jgi:hypothetical protein
MRNAGHDGEIILPNLLTDDDPAGPASCPKTCDLGANASAKTQVLSLIYNVGPAPRQTWQLLRSMFSRTGRSRAKSNVMTITKWRFFP